MKKILLILILTLCFTAVSYAEITRTYYDTGEVKCEYEKFEKYSAVYIDCYYKNGKLKEKWAIENGKYEGPYVSYFDNGKVSTEFLFKEGVVDGVYKIYSKQGFFKSTGVIKNNQKHGPSKFYYTNGFLYARVIYDKDKAVAGLCASGRRWNKTDIANWEKGIPVECDLEEFHSFNKKFNNKLKEPVLYDEYM